MAYSYNLGTDIGKIRLLIMDNTLDQYLFEDDELSAFLTFEASNVKRAAALALDTMASNEAYVIKKMSLLDLTVDGPAVAQSLRTRASDLREQADRDDMLESGGAFDIAEWVVDTFTWRQYEQNEAVRG